MNWWLVYGLTISLWSLVAVFLMHRIVRRMRQHVDAMHGMLTPTVLAASDMWDKLTPEQIRTLHPHTVDVGNGVPSWRVVQEAINHAKDKIETTNPKSEEP